MYIFITHVRYGLLGGFYLLNELADTVNPTFCFELQTCLPKSFQRALQNKKLLPSLAAFIYQVFTTDCLYKSELRFSKVLRIYSCVPLYIPSLSDDNSANETVDVCTSDDNESDLDFECPSDDDDTL